MYETHLRTFGRAILLDDIAALEWKPPRYVHPDGIEVFYCDSKLDITLHDGQRIEIDLWEPLEIALAAVGVATLWERWRLREHARSKAVR